MKTKAPSTVAPEQSKVLQAVNRERLLDTAMRLVSQPSRTGEAGAAADELESLLKADGFVVERHVAGHADAPAVVVRFSSGLPGSTLQFDGHLDTVHLPFVPPKVVDGRLTGSGAADMKAGIAASVEALRALRDSGELTGGEVLFTAHDLHEAPWGDGRQLDALIADGIVGDAVLIPEYLNNVLPVIGRGGFIWTIEITRPGPPIHEVLRPDEPSVISAGALLVSRLDQLNIELSKLQLPMAGSESMFIGNMQSGSIYNEYPHSCRLEGTRRWLPRTRMADADQQLRAICAEVAQATGTHIQVQTRLMRDAFKLDLEHRFTDVFQSTYTATSGKSLPHGGKPFVDDGNSFWSSAGIPAITHGPNAGGAHTTAEWVEIDDLVRIAGLYALIASVYCPHSDADTDK